MSRITTQSIFNTSVHKPSWQSYIVSTVVHVGLAALAFAIVIPMAVEVHKSLDHITLVAPIPEFKPKPPVAHLIAPKINPHPIIPTPVKTFVPPPVVLPVVKQRPVIEAPEIKPVPPQPVLKVDLPPAPKAPIKTGSFLPTVELAKGPPPPPKTQVQVGGFGDPHGVPPSDNSRASAATLAKVGAFDMPDGAGKSGRGGSAQGGGAIRQTGFGSSGTEGTPKPTQSTAQAIRSTGFGEATLAAPTAKKTENLADAQTPVQILSKPKPLYTPEARELRLEGEVSLQVIFQADGTIHVVRVVRGLGHGLDEAAVQAATRVRFKPATRGGVPVDTNATMKISFELT
jgi:TonB family protein